MSLGLEDHEIAYLRSAAPDGTLSERAAHDFDVDFQSLVFKRVIEVVGDKLMVTGAGKEIVAKSR